MLSAKQVKPGQSGQIEVSVKTEPTGAPSALAKSVTVKTNDPRQPQLTLLLQGSIVPEIELSERSIYFGNNPKGKEVVKEIMVTVAPDRPIKLIGAESTDQSVLVKLEQLPDADGKKYKLIAIQKADTKEGYHFGSVVIKTTSKLAPEIKVAVRGIVAAAQNSQ